MKKLFSLILAALLLLCPALAEEKEENWYLDTAGELARCVGELAADETFLQMMSSVSFDCMEPLKEADFENILSAWHYDMSTIENILALVNMSDEFRMSETGREYLASRMPATIISMYSGSYGAENVAAAAMLTYTRSYIMPEGFEPCIITLELDRGAIAVAFGQGGDGIVTATAAPLFGDEKEDYGEAARSLAHGFPLIAPRQLL